jgi:hypothetical protein
MDRKWPVDVELFQMFQMVPFDVCQDLRPEFLTFTDGNRGGMCLGLFGEGKEVRTSQNNLPATLEKIVGNLIRDGGQWSANGDGDNVGPGVVIDLVAEEHVH